MMSLVETLSADFLPRFLAGMAVNFGGAPQSQYTDLVLSSNINNAQIFDTGSSFAGWAGPGSLNLYTSSGPIGFHPAGNANALYLGASGLVSLGTTAQPSRLYVEDWGNAAGSGAGRFFEGAAGGYALAGIAQTSAVGAGDEYGVWAQADTNSGNAYAVYATAACISCGSPVWGVYIARGGAAKPGGGRPSIYPGSYVEWVAKTGMEAPGVHA